MFRCEETFEEKISYLQDPEEHKKAWKEHVGKGGHYAKCWTPPAVWPPVYEAENFKEERQELRELEASVVVTPLNEKSALRRHVREAKQRLVDLESAKIRSKAAAKIPWEEVFNSSHLLLFTSESLD